MNVRSSRPRAINSLATSSRLAIFYLCHGSSSQTEIGQLLPFKAGSNWPEAEINDACYVYPAIAWEWFLPKTGTHGKTSSHLQTLQDRQPH